ncbi:putative flagellin YvzB [compost metagenome]
MLDGSATGVVFHIGANTGQNISLSIGSMDASTLGVAQSATSGIDISTQTAADAAISTINAAIETVSGERAKLGANQNRLKHTINNLNTSSENLSAAESRIRDVDMAKEMMNQTKNNILAQAAQAMLAQANQQPQGVLQLLR